MFHSNLFLLLKTEPLPVFRYNVAFEPKPTNKVQSYQILGAVAKRIMFEEKKAIISNKGLIESLCSRIPTETSYSVEIPNLGKFNTTLSLSEEANVSIDDFESYKLLVNRIVDIALTIFSDYRQYYPDAPYVLKKEPYFDSDLIEKTGIIDWKKYYRGLHSFTGRNVLALNRETELVSNKNLLVEMTSLASRFDSIYGVTTDFYNPSQAFVDYINSLFVGKAADVHGYPGPRIRRIRKVTWQYRAKDVSPGTNSSILDYLRTNYGITGLDKEQPVIEYEIENPLRLQYHIPELLSVGHNFQDLERRIPSWRRSQVWGSIHPDCKNQLQKIFGVLSEIDSILRARLPEVYPRLIEFSKDPLDVTSLVATPAEIKLKFSNKDLPIQGKYDEQFYHGYSGKKISFAVPSGHAKACVCTNMEEVRIQNFLKALSEEYEIRNGAKLEFDISQIDLARRDYRGYDVVISITHGKDDEAAYAYFKKIVQNELGVPHQHITAEHADESSVMALVMELTLKLGGEPWLLSEPLSAYVVGVYSYLNPESQEELVYANVLSGEGKLLAQFAPRKPTDVSDLFDELSKFKFGKREIIYLISYDRFGIMESLKSILSQDTEYALVQIDDQNFLRFFETWVPKKAPRFGKAKQELAMAPVEAMETAPQGVALKSAEDESFLVTGKTIQKDSTWRGCPAPIRVKILDKKGESWNTESIKKSIFDLSMMGRASGHMTTLPSPLYYLHLQAYYDTNFGRPMDPLLAQRIYYI